MNNFFADIISITLFCLALIFGFVAALCLGDAYFSYKMNKSECNLFIAKESVYKGRCHFIGIHPVSENANTKHVIIYKDIFRLKPVREFLNDDVEVKELK